ncbi:MAG: cell division protein ZapA [Pseudomonadota bacterium]
MADVALSIGGRSHVVACRDGEEAHLRHLAATLDRHHATAERASGGISGERTMLLLALILADQLDEAAKRPAGEQADAALARVADQLEAVAAALEETAPNA